MFLKISQNSQETSVSVLFLIKLLALTCNFIKKETVAQVFSCEFCEISKYTFFKEHLWAAVSARSNTALSQEKTSQRLNIPSRVLYNDALTNNHVRCVSSNQFSLVGWLCICFLNYKISLFLSIKLSCNNRLCLQLICRAKFFIY